MEDDRFFERGPKLTQAIDHEVGGRTARGKAQPGFRGVRAMEAKGGELDFGLQIVIQGLVHRFIKTFTEAL